MWVAQLPYLNPNLAWSKPLTNARMRSFAWPLLSPTPPPPLWALLREDHVNIRKIAVRLIWFIFPSESFICLSSFFVPQRTPVVWRSPLRCLYLPLACPCPHHCPSCLEVRSWSPSGTIGIYVLVRDWWTGQCVSFLSESDPVQCFRSLLCPW